MSAEIENQRHKNGSSLNFPWFLAFSASFLLAIAFAAIIAVSFGFSSGKLTPYWNELGDGRGAIIAQLLTLYAAAFAAVFVPLIFRGQVRDLKKQIESVTVELQSLADESRASFRVLSDYAHRQVGIKQKYTTEDESNANQIIGGMRSIASNISKEILDGSDLHGRTKNSAFAGKWPGYKTYTKLLKEYELISDDERELLDRIAGSTKHTRENNPEPATASDLNLIADAVRKLERMHELRKARWGDG